jgi:N-carbamoyl-L-amino-acid hydrolase
LGSHLDSQPKGGIYDGALGIVAALEFVKTLNDNDITTEHPLEIVNWTNEEGSRFQPTMQGSGVWVGKYDLQDEYEKTDEEGISFKQELEQIGYRGSAPAAPQEPYEAYLELHIEQGPSLDAGDYNVGVVTGVVGLWWGAVTFSGEPNHSGSTPMEFRQDALVSAADFITRVRRIASTLGPDTVGTVGYIDADPNSINVIPGEVTVTFGFRDPSDDVLDRAKAKVLAAAEQSAALEDVNWDWEQRSRDLSVQFAPHLIDTIEDAATSKGYRSTRLFSGGVHDAAHLASICDSGMVFAVSEDGKSHSEDEHTSWDDCYIAADTFANAALQLATPTNTEHN